MPSADEPSVADMAGALASLVTVTSAPGIAEEPTASPLGGSALDASEQPTVVPRDEPIPAEVGEPPLLLADPASVATAGPVLPAVELPPYSAAESMLMLSAGPHSAAGIEPAPTLPDEPTGSVPPKAPTPVASSVSSIVFVLLFFLFFSAPFSPCHFLSGL